MSSPRLDDSVRPWQANLRRILLADDWDEGFPLRKDYPLRGWREFPVYNKERIVPRQRTRWTGRES